MSILTRRALLRSSFATPALIIPKKVDAAFATFMAHSDLACSASPPAAAAAFGYNTCTFQSIFPNLDRVDINNLGTSTASTDWWVSNPSQNFVVPPGNFSIAQGAMRISKGAGVANTDNSPSLMSIYLPFGAAANAWHGRSFKNGFYIEFNITFDETIANWTDGPPTSFPAYWADSAVAGSSPTFNPHHVEPDFFEAVPGVIHTVQNLFKIHEFGNSGHPDASTEYNQYGSLLWDGSTFNKIGKLWVPTTKNSGIGLWRTFVNDVNFVDDNLTYSLTGPATSPTGNPADPSNYNGVYSYCENVTDNPNGFAIFITCGSGLGYTDWPLYTKSVRVWQTQMSDMVVL